MKIIASIAFLAIIYYVTEKVVYERDSCEYVEEWFVYFWISFALKVCFVVWSVIVAKFVGVFS